MMNALEPWHIVILVVVLIALFGAKRLPDTARGIGKSMRIFRHEMRDHSDEPAVPADNSAGESPQARPSQIPPAQ